MVNTKFEYQDYRDRAAEVLKAEPDKEKRKEILKEIKDTPRHKASELLRDEDRSNIIIEGKEKKEKIILQNIASIKELKTKIPEKLQRILDHVRVEIEKERENTNKKISYMEHSIKIEKFIDSLKKVTVFLEDHLEEINQKMFLISILIGDLSNNGYKELDLTKEHSYNDIYSFGLSVIHPEDVNGVTGGSGLRFNLSHPDPYDQIESETSYFLTEMERSFKKTRSDIPTHKILK